MAITPEDCVERIISELEATTSGEGELLFPHVRTALHPIVKQKEFDLFTSTSGAGTSGAALPLPQTLASFVWYLPVCQNTPITQPYTYPVLRPIASGALIEAFVEVGIAASGGNILFEFYKNNLKIGEVTLPVGQTTITVPIAGSFEDRSFTRDDFFAFKVTENVTIRARFLTVYLRFFQFPFVMGDNQDPLPVPV